MVPALQVAAPQATLKTDPGVGGLIGELDAAQPIIVANGWTSVSRIAQVRSSLVSDGATTQSLHKILVDRALLTRDQGAELEQLIAHQAYFPRYQLLRRIGSGGMGMVYLARQKDTGREVAFKTINARLANDDDFMHRFHRETQVLLGIKHEAVAEVIESGEAGGHIFLAMEFIDGPSLMNLLKDYKVLPETFALRVIQQIAAGLHHVNTTAGLIHRDIKPENILVIDQVELDKKTLSMAVRAKLIDFGLVKSSREDERLTQTGMTIGTPLYMSPEQIRGEDLDGRSDVYGLGATLYHLLTGMTPFTGGSPGAIMSAHLTEAVPDPGRVVPSLHPLTRKLVLMAMAKKSTARFLTLDALSSACGDALREILGASGEPGTERIQFLKRPLVLKQPSVIKPPTDRVGLDEIRPDTSEIQAQPIDPESGRRPGTGPRPESGPRPASGPERRPSTQPVRRPGTGPTQNLGMPSDRRPGTEPVRRNGAASDRHLAQRPGSDSVKKPGRAGTEASESARPVSDAVRKAVAQAAPRAQPGTSRVFHEDHEPQGVGVGPWLFLGAAAMVVVIILLVVARGL